mmetsp:Transcript_16318/g.18601  ORF Transcript_16318/g.18601 Transcript_16318/m.18601 type:complete len:427 (-) Transcript_16318:42-1322(-)
MNELESVKVNGLVRVRAITAFLSLSKDDFQCTKKYGETMNNNTSSLRSKVLNATKVLHAVRDALVIQGNYEVQTIRIATNRFGEYLQSELLECQLSELDSTLEKAQIDFFSVGPAITIDEIDSCPIIVSKSHRFSCSAEMRSGDDVTFAKKTAECMKIISQLGNKMKGDHVKEGLGNFRFCATACCKDFTPFFPAAKGPSLKNITIDTIPFSIGLENGKLANQLLELTSSIDKISTCFKKGMADALMPIQTICKSISSHTNKSIPQCAYMGIDTSLNPSLDENGSIAEAMEKIKTIKKFGGPGTIAVAAEITKSLKDLPGIDKVGYCGLMLPVCEDVRLASLASSRDIDTTRLVGISSVCGVGLDTVPVPDCDIESLMSLILDVSSLSYRYGKSLSCRLLICPGAKEGDKAEFNSPYMCDCKIFDI